MPNLNGKVVVEILNTVKEPATMKQIVELVAESALTPPEEIKPVIIYTLQKGVDYGFIQRKRGRYFIEDMGELVNSAVKESCFVHNRLVEQRKADRPQSRRLKRRHSH